MGIATRALFVAFGLLGSLMTLKALHMYFSERREWWFFKTYDSPIRWFFLLQAILNPILLLIALYCAIWAIVYGLFGIPLFPFEGAKEGWK